MQFFYLMGPWANRMTQAKQGKTFKGFWGYSLGNLRPSSSDLLKTTPFFVPQLALQVNLHWDVHSPPKKKKPNLPKAMVELIALCFWYETSLLAFPQRAS